VKKKKRTSLEREIPKFKRDNREEGLNLNQLVQRVEGSEERSKKRKTH
jgi:hypothetical protein